ncbi:MAG: hypothetical protein M3348_16605 [Acidobacteriota bacterium]|nr:hypothetical protein [Acidobacteriota bacterium]
MKKLYIALALAALTVAAASLVTAAQAGSDKDGQSKAATPDIAGTWLVNLSLNGAANTGGAANASPARAAQQNPGARTQEPFIAVETFHPDGTFTETSLTDYLPPQGPPGQGVWERTGGREFALTIYGVSIGSVINPQFQGTYKVRSKLTLSGKGDEFSGPFVIELYDPAGNLAFTLEGAAQGRRARLDPLP